MDRLTQEINSFKNLWKGGFKTGYKTKRNQKGIEEYLQNNIQNNITLLEIGCGGGQWTNFLHKLNRIHKIYAIDALSEEHNNFWNYVGEDGKNLIEYIQVNDFKLDCIPDDSLDFVFSYDVFCHISKKGQEEYLKNLYKKCRKECKLMIMYADAKKYLNNEPENTIFVKRYLPGGESKKYTSNNELIDAAVKDCDGRVIVGRWYWIGIDNFIGLCEEFGYVIEERDINIDKTNPITVFGK